MGVPGTGLVRAGAVAACLWLTACATAPKLSTDELEKRIDAQVTQTHALDQRFAAFQSAGGHPGAAESAAKSEGPFYNSEPARFPEIDARQKRWVKETLTTALEQRGAARLDYLTGKGTVQFVPPWGDQSFEGIPLEVLLATSFGASRRLRGAESDVRISDRRGGARMVTIWNETGDRIEVKDAVEAPLPPVGATALQVDALRAQYGIGPIEGWDGDELDSLARALALLSPPERAAIAGLPFRRLSKPTGEFKLPTPPPGTLSGEGTHCGLFVWKDANRRWIEIYDCAFTLDALAFVGNPDRPLHPSVRVILHEIGHAIGKREMTALVGEMVLSNGQALELFAEFNRHGKNVPASELSRFKHMNDELADIAKVMNHWNETTQAGGLATPAVLASFDQVRAGQGFTSYGRWNLDEAFAEAFSLYRADPDACRRISPAVFAFFDTGRHTAEK
jgi:hypothetical protein